MQHLRFLAMLGIKTQFGHHQEELSTEDPETWNQDAIWTRPEKFITFTTNGTSVSQHQPHQLHEATHVNCLLLSYPLQPLKSFGPYSSTQQLLPIRLKASCCRTISKIINTHQIRWRFHPPGQSAHAQCSAPAKKLQERSPDSATRKPCFLWVYFSQRPQLLHLIIWAEYFIVRSGFKLHWRWFFQLLKCSLWCKI